MAVEFTEDSRIAASKDQVSCNLAGEMAILNLKNGVYYGLDPVGARIWNLIQEPMTFAQILETLLDEYDVDRPRLDADIPDLLVRLMEHGLIEITA